MSVSIITPTFNAVDFIQGCIENAAAQGPEVLEHIIADGGSTDGTVELVERLKVEHTHLRLLPGPDKGQSDAMNKATKIARGDIIGILNADDFYEPDTVARAARRLKQAKGATLICGDCRIVNIDGTEILMNRPKNLTSEAFLQDSWLFPIPANPSAYFYTSDVHEIVGGYDIDDSMSMDCEFLMTCAERVTMIYVPEHWGNFRYIPGCKTFDDSVGPARVTEIIRRHRNNLTRQQKIKMKMMMAVEKGKFSLGKVLRQARLRR